MTTPPGQVGKSLLVERGRVNARTNSDVELGWGVGMVQVGRQAQPLVQLGKVIGRSRGGSGVDHTLVRCSATHLGTFRALSYSSTWLVYTMGPGVGGLGLPKARICAALEGEEIGEEGLTRDLMGLGIGGVGGG